MGLSQSGIQHAVQKYLCRTVSTVYGKSLCSLRIPEMATFLQETT